MCSQVLRAALACSAGALSVRGGHPCRPLGCPASQLTAPTNGSAAPCLAALRAKSIDCSCHGSGFTFYKRQNDW